MATSVFFDGRKISLPGAYSTVKSGIKNPAVALEFGNCLIIDTGSSRFFGGGSGIAGTLKQNLDSIYTFTDVGSAQAHQHGGIFWFLSSPIFFPGGGATQGASSLTFIKAALTTPSSVSYTFTGGGGNGGTFTLRNRAEGRVGNGVMGDETRGAATVTISNAGTVGTSTFTITSSGETIATYATQVGDNIASVVAGLVNSINSLGISAVVSSTSTTVTFSAPRGLGIAANTITPVLVATATGAGSISGAYTGGVTGTRLTRGYAARMIAGVIDPTRFIMQFSRGTFRGLSTDISDGTPYDGVSELSTTAEVVAQSPEFSNISTLIAWMDSDPTFQSYFERQSSSIAGTGLVNAGDLSSNSALRMFTGGTDTYGSQYLTQALDAIAGSTYDFILADNWGDNARSANNLAIQAYATAAKIKPDVYIGGGNDSSKWNSGVTSSVNMAQAFNSQFVTLVHSGVKRTDFNGRLLKNYQSIYHAAVMMGREAGLAPQVPLTFKNIGVDGVVHQLRDNEAIAGLDAGVLMTRADGSAFEVVKGVNTLQINSYLVNPDGSTSSKQLARIVRQLNKELIINGKRTLLKKPNGANRNTLSAEDVKTWVEAYLTSKVATDQLDNLIISFQNVTVTVQGDAYFINYGVIPNYEVSFLLFSGLLLDPIS
jgi:hypothetical protein